MQTLYATLIGVMVLLMVVPLAAAGQRSFPAWDKQINDPKRFKVLDDFGDAAVYDKETGLVWDRFPETGTQNYFSALIHCYQRVVGGRMGWRPPTIEELASLVDVNNPSGNPDLPPGHPFPDVQPSFYWSGTTYALVTTSAWIVNFFVQDVNHADKMDSYHVWCVRGGQGIDGVQ